MLLLALINSLPLRFDARVAIKSFEDSENRLPFVALQQSSQRIYGSTLAKLVLFCTRHNTAAVEGVPALSAAVAAASTAIATTPTTNTVQALLRLLFQPHPANSDASSQDPVLWFVRLFAFSTPNTLSVQLVHRTCAHLVYSCRYFALYFVLLLFTFAAKQCSLLVCGDMLREVCYHGERFEQLLQLVKYPYVLC